MKMRKRVRNLRQEIEPGSRAVYFSRSFVEFRNRESVYFTVTYNTVRRLMI